jgi:hypothetical protein
MSRNIPIGVIAAQRLAAGGGGGPSSYTQNWVDTDGVQYFSFTGGGEKENPFAEFSVWFSLDNLSQEAMFFNFGLDTYVRITTSGAVDVRVEGTLNFIAWDFTSAAGVISAGTRYHLYMGYDLANATATLLLDGSDLIAGGTNNNGPSATAQDVEMNKVGEVGDQLFGGSPKFSGELADLWVDNPSALNGYSAFADGSGNPKNLSGLTTPLIHMGGAMVASDWNVGDNNGTITMTVEGSGSYSDAT